jgi:AAA15 family ATPase/GTPase
MFKSITIKNFRCFEQFTIDHLKRVNLISGVNNIGKTAFLESVFLLSGLNSIELPFKLNFLRGILRQDTIDFEDICEWLFFEKQSNKVISINTINDQEENSELHLKLDKARENRLFPINSKNNKRGIFKDLCLEYNQGNKKFSVRLFLTIDEEDREIKIGIKQEDGQLDSFPPSEFLSSRLRILPTEDAEKFSNLEVINTQDKVIEILKILEPRLKRLAVLVTGGVPTIYGDIGLSYLIPIPLMGEGIGRLLSVVLAIFNNQNGTILIDEIENGLHHSITTKIWIAIAEAARQTNNQIFATTHSLECIKSAHNAFINNENYDFAYHRFQRVNNVIESVTYDQETIATSIEMDFEMR